MGVVRRLAFPILLALAIQPSPAAAQQQRGPELPASYLALEFLKGRFRMPVTCTREDGSRVELEESVVFRPAKNRDGTQTLRMTFFGLDSPGLARCYNLTSPSVPDRRGTLYLSYASLNRRPDIGLKDFRHALRSGPLEYVIVGGHLRVREVGSAPDAARVFDFGGSEVPFWVSLVRRDSDPDKLLGDPEPVEGRLPRKLTFRFEAPDGLRFEESYLEDGSRWK